MTFRLQISCDAPGCDATALLDDDDLAMPTAENLPDQRRAMFVLDTDWIETPVDWMLGEGGLLCPAHSGEVTS